MGPVETKTRTRFTITVEDVRNAQKKEGKRADDSSIIPVKVESEKKHSWPQDWICENGVIRYRPEHHLNRNPESNGHLFYIWFIGRDHLLSTVEMIQIPDDVVNGRVPLSQFYDRTVFADTPTIAIRAEQYTLFSGKGLYPITQEEYDRIINGIGQS